MLKTFAALGIGTALTFSSAAALAQQKWDMPTGYPTSNFHTANIQLFAKDVEKATGGKLTLTIHDNGSLFKANEIKRSVQGGQAQIGEIIISGYSNENVLFGVDSIPFLATSYAESEKLWKATKAATEALLAKQGLKVLYAVPWPPQGIFSAKPIDSAADLKGAKWRAYNPNTSRIAQLVGAQPVTVQAAELTQALATGTVNTFMTSGATGYDSKVWEQVKYYYDVSAWLPKNLVIVSRKAFDGLDKPTQDGLLKAAAEAEARGWKVSQEKNTWYLEQLAKNGMKIEQGSAQLKADLKKVGEQMIGDWMKQAGPEGQAMLDAYRK
ncbi:TRAP transporter substrate-binding protein [Accumulibacter sp.]|uniref:TRAP transporter substrate-binding protein n=1 Tax=Accumulibacter sp. TaxID=2053492 RepID=UPI002BB33B80|nr:TRAP transporter substrate-binding protein [Accumulibacter sp.]HMV18946.1 TRAP transporter substrate-binding protein [Rhodocyclaceae bacterium]HMW64847.1 TRAP transporter substrate-binding protein [Accumulibacter sp.]HMW80967.1 TRAP transporter substrate-binding protein [Accumulibacter sp.]HNB68674.1 TRAP transporter substrate-binding protein [Accumulibacter sp.]HND39890.1 TRAP transporter substrate-binding protein [Accumulibacter sp.]